MRTTVALLFFVMTVPSGLAMPSGKTVIQGKSYKYVKGKIRQTKRLAWGLKITLSHRGRPDQFLVSSKTKYCGSAAMRSARDLRKGRDIVVIYDRAKSGRLYVAQYIHAARLWRPRLAFRCR